jgi:hypothetical protein
MAVTEECVPNIGERGRNRRRRNGVFWLVGAVAASILVATGRVPDWALLMVFATALLSGLGFFQAREKT